VIFILNSAVGGELHQRNFSSSIIKNLQIQLSISVFSKHILPSQVIDYSKYFIHLSKYACRIIFTFTLKKTYLIGKLSWKKNYLL